MLNSDINISYKVPGQAAVFVSNRVPNKKQDISGGIRAEAAAAYSSCIDANADHNTIAATVADHIAVCCGTSAAAVANHIWLCVVAPVAAASLLVALTLMLVVTPSRQPWPTI